MDVVLEICRRMSMRWLVVLLVGLVVACSPADGAGKAGASFAFDLGRNDASGGPCRFDYQAALAGVDSLSGQVTWSTDIPWSNGGRGFAVADGLDVVDTAPTEVISPGVVAVNEADGSPIWQTSVRSPVFDIVAVGGGRLLVATVGFVQLLDSATGAELWTYKSSATLMRAAWSDSEVFVHDNGVVRALDIETGKVVWEVDADTDGSYPPVVIDRTVLLARWDQPLLAFNAEDGRILWQIDLGPGGNPIVGQLESIIVVFRSDRRELVGIDQAGTAEWSLPVLAESGEEIRIIDGLIVDRNGMVAVVDPGASQPHVIHQFNDETGTLRAAGTENLVAVVEWGFSQNTTTTLSVLNRVDGSLVWTQTLGEFLTPADPVINGNAVIIGTGAGFGATIVDDPANGNLTAFDLSTSEMLWTTSFRDAVHSPLPIGNGLIVLSSDPSIFCD